MTLSIAQTPPATAAVDALVIGVIPKGKGVELAAHGLDPADEKAVLAAPKPLKATGKAGEIHRLTGIAGVKAPLVVTVGLGEIRETGPDLETLRRSVGSAVRALAGNGKAAIVVPADETTLRAIALGARLAAYEFTAFKSKPSAGPAPVKQLLLLLPCAPTKAHKQVVNEVNAIAAAVDLTRDLVNTPPNALPPAKLAKAAREAVAELPVKVTI